MHKTHFLAPNINGRADRADAFGFRVNAHRTARVSHLHWNLRKQTVRKSEHRVCVPAACCHHSGVGELRNPSDTLCLNNTFYLKIPKCSTKIETPYPCFTLRSQEPGRKKVTQGHREQLKDLRSEPKRFCSSSCFSQQAVGKIQVLALSTAVEAVPAEPVSK